jgi:DNA mismatch repair protein MutS2
MPLYTLGYDQVGGSRALDVARDRGLPQEILSRAEEYLLLDGKDSSQLMSRLNELAVNREQEIQALQEQKKSLHQEQKRLQAKLEQEARQLLEEIRTRSRDVVAQWKAGKRQRKQTLRELAAEKNRLRSQLQAEGSETGGQASIKPPAPGDRVYYRSWGRKGLVREVDARKSRIKLDLGGVTIWVPDTEVQAEEQPAADAAPAFSYRGGPAGHGAPGRVDLRGMRSDEAVTALQQHVDHALLQGRKELEIIHGRGTGALRKAVQDELARLPGITEYYLANEQQGGDGVTIIRLQ